jgi:hypothetical protein
MAGLITGTLATHLEANRDTLNQRVLELQRSSAGFDPQVFADAISDLVPPILAAVEAEGDGFASIVAQSLVDAALELAASGQLEGAIRDAWVSLLPRLGAQLAQEPRRIVAAVSNALANLQRNPGARPAQWLATMTALAPSTDAATFLAAGQVAAWRAGMAAFRADALAIARSLDPAVLQVAAGASPAQLDQLAQDPWFDPAPGPTGGGGDGAVRVGSFRGFGGAFVRPPLLALLDDHVVATDGDGEWFVFADAFGSAVVRAGGTAARAVSTQGAPPVALDIPEVLSWVVAPGGVVVSSALSHAVIFTKARP